MKKRLLLLVLLFGLLRVSAADLALTLMTPSAPVSPGANIPVDLVGLNSGSIDVPFDLPSTLTGRASGAGSESVVTLTSATAAPNAVAPGGFAVRRYVLSVPAAAAGRTHLEVSLPGSPPLHAVIEVQASTRVAEPVLTPLAELASSVPVASALARTFAGRFLPNQPIYFLYGSGSDQAAKFQFSFDYRLARLGWGEAGREKISTLRLGYTQRSLWDIDASSSPFYDTSYMPEVAVVTDLPLRSQAARGFTWMGLRAGYLHESNGRDGAESRSLNTFYVRPRFILGSLNAWFVVVLPELHVYVGGFSENERIKDYRGYGKLRFYFGKNDGPTLRVSMWAGKDFDHSTYQLDLTCPLSLRWLNVESYLQVQYFNGYGESLRSYETKSDAVRFGFALVR